jgi:histidinol-phosphate aminotransferase
VEAARLGNLYPGSGPDLRKKLGKASGLSGDAVVLGNGSTDVINFVVHTFVGPGDEVVIPVPTFPMYEARVKVAGGVVVQVPMKPDFYWDMPAILKAVTPRTKLIFVCSPNNPTGLQIAEKDLLQILELGIPTFFDEAYYELEDEVITRAGLIHQYPHMLVNRTFSKAFGLAGCRIGYLLCDPVLASYFNRVRIPWNVSLLALAAALAGFEDQDDQQRKRKNTIEGRPESFPFGGQFRPDRCQQPGERLVGNPRRYGQAGNIHPADERAQHGTRLHPNHRGHARAKPFLHYCLQRVRPGSQ